VLRTRRALVLENLALRHQLAVLQRAAPRPRLHHRDRLFWVFLYRLWSGWADALSIVQPETVIRWQRTGFRLYWTRKSRRREQGRPAVSPEVRGLIRQMSHANLSFAFRYGGALGNRLLTTQRFQIWRRTGLSGEPKLYRARTPWGRPI
jgi:hypothetical protein